MDFSAVVLMERDKETKHLVKELGSYEVNEGAEYITKLFYDGEKVNLFFDTNRDVEEWEFTAIYDLFDEESFNGIVSTIEPDDEEYNPTWIVTFDYNEDHEVFKMKINEICEMIKHSMNKVFNDISDRREDYQ